MDQARTRLLCTLIVGLALSFKSEAIANVNDSKGPAWLRDYSPLLVTRLSF